MDNPVARTRTPNAAGATSGLRAVNRFTDQLGTDPQRSDLPMDAGPHIDPFEVTRDHRDDSAWDAFLASHPTGHHEQSSGYAQARAKWGFGSLRFVAHDGTSVIGGAQLLTRVSPLGTFATVQRGPLAHDGREDVLTCIAAAIDDTASKRSWHSVRVDTFPTQTAARGALTSFGFLENRAWVDVKPSLLIGLCRSNDALLSSMTQKARYNVRLAERSGVCVKVAEATDLAEFHRLHLQTAQYQSFPTLPEAYFQDVYDVFASSGRAVAFIAYAGSEAIAAIFNTVVDHRMYYGWGGLDRAPHHSRLMANYLLHYTAMQWARDHGSESYDLCGTTEFKRKLGGEPLSWPVPLRKFYGGLARVRRAIFETSWNHSFARQQVDRVTRRLGYRQRLPY